MNAPRVLVVGAGPAGTRAGETLSAAGARVSLVDEAPASGGQIYRRPPAGFTRPPAALYGFEAAKARRLHAAFDALKPAIDYRPQTLVWNLWQGTAHLHGPAGPETLAFDAVLLATGAMDRVVPFRGWTRPGVFTLGAAQIALKHQACLIGRRVVFAGSGPLLYLVAYQYAKAGATIAAIVDSARGRDSLAALPALAAGRSSLLKGLYYRAALMARGIPHYAGAHPAAAEGSERIDRLHIATARGAQTSIACDAVAIGWGLKPETQLADLLGCPFRYDRRNRQWLPELDGDGRAGLPGVYLAGDGAGILGADAAERRGELAALALLADHGVAVDEARRNRLRAELARHGRFRDGLERAFPFPAEMARAIPDDALLCRCEAITAGEYRAALGSSRAPELNRAKALSRVGMGRCQGRVCGPAAAEVAAAHLGCRLEAVGRLRGQAPVKPLPIGAFAPAADEGRA